MRFARRNARDRAAGAVCQMEDLTMRRALRRQRERLKYLDLGFGWIPHARTRLCADRRAPGVERRGVARVDFPIVTGSSRGRLEFRGGRHQGNPRASLACEETRYASGVGV